MVVVLDAGSVDALSDAATYDDTAEDAPNGTLYSTADLTIGGTGSLTVTGNYNDGMVSKDGLVMAGGTVEVAGVDDGILGKDYPVLVDGRIPSRPATTDRVGQRGRRRGLDADRGRHLNVSAGDDGIEGVNALASGGTITVAGSKRPWKARTS